MNAVSLVDIPQAPRPIDIKKFTVDELLAQIEPEKYLLPGVPAEAYSLIAGALSSYKTTLLFYLLVWKATGWDILGLDDGPEIIDIGKAVLVTYEDTDARILAKFQRVIQHGYQVILKQWGNADAIQFVERAADNLTRVTLSGKSGLGIVCRDASNAVVPNEFFLEEFSKAVRAFAPDGALIGIDPLRLAMVGSQNDDDGAEVVVQTLNRLSTLIPNSGLLIASHTTKNGAKDVGDSYTDASYATSGSALFSQHARSNFLMVRLKSTEIESLFSSSDVTPEEAKRQQVAKLTHGRLSHGDEQGAVYLLMRKGTLIRVRPQRDKTAAESITAVATLIIPVIRQMRAEGITVSANSLEKDDSLKRAIGGRNELRTAVALLKENGYVKSEGKTSNLTLEITEKGRPFTGESRRESSREGD